MSTQLTARTKNVDVGRAAWIDKIPGSRILRNLKIGSKLTLGFGILVILTLLVVAFSYLGSIPATTSINQTGEVRVPTALASARAQANLLRMEADVRGYLALGDEAYRQSYEQRRQAFEADLADLEALSPNFDVESQQQLNELKTVFAEWVTWPPRLFALRNDQLEREPAYNLLATDGSLLAGNVLISINKVIDTQSQRPATSDNLQLLSDMADFQGTFAAMFSALRGYVTTRNRIYRQEYEVNRELNEFAWERLLDAKNRLNNNQQTELTAMEENRAAYLTLPEQIFTLLESERWREDLYLFSTEAVPRIEQINELLGNLTTEQQALLRTELNRGRIELVSTNQRNVFSGIVAVILGLALAFLIRENIAAPIRRLTNVANMIREGDLEAQATVESQDEIGVLARTFNAMTNRLRDTLVQVRKEKQRADDLLDVVIPIGIELSSEKDFDRLLEKMLMEAKNFCNADAGILYLRTPQETLEAVILRNTSLNMAMGGTSNQKVSVAPIPLSNAETQMKNDSSIAAYTVLKGESVNVANSYKDERFKTTNKDTFQSKVFDKQTNYRSISYLSIPLKNNDDEVIGAMQLINATDPFTGEIIPFDPNLQEMMESFSSLAVAALEAYRREQTLRQEIQQLKIEIDEAKRERAVKAIVETDTFSDLQARAQEMRRRRKKKRSQKKDSSSDQENET